MRQWAGAARRRMCRSATVSTIEPVSGLPDMVFAANGATVIDGTVLGVRFQYPERAGEAAAYLSWFRAHGYAPCTSPVS